VSLLTDEDKTDLEEVFRLAKLKKAAAGQLASISSLHLFLTLETVYHFFSKSARQISEFSTQSIAPTAYYRF